MNPLFDDLGHGIYCIDIHYARDRLACCYLVVEGDQAAIVETGTVPSCDNVLATIAELGLTPEQVRYIVPTHVHLDHAGGAGALMEACPNAELVVHPSGARHLIDPSKLIAGTIAVYGEENYRALYGDIVPVAAERVVESRDGMVLDLNTRPLLLRHTPGHANHHHSIWDARSKGWFSGDIFGVSYEKLHVSGQRYGVITTTPVQFDPKAMRDSVQLMLDYSPARIYLTHFSVIDNPQQVGQQLLEQIEPFCQIAHNNLHAADRVDRIEAELMAYFLADIAQRDSTADLDLMRDWLTMDLKLSAQGLDVWLTRQQR